MNEIKAYFRPQLADQVVDALEKAGAKDLTVIRVDAFGPLADSATDEHHFARKFSKMYSAVAKLELVCRDENAARFAQVIHEKAHTGDHGDGRIFIADVLYPIISFLLNLMIAGAAMSFSSVSVVANALRLRAVNIAR